MLLIYIYDTFIKITGFEIGPFLEIQNNTLAHSHYYYYWLMGQNMIFLEYEERHFDILL